VPTMKELHDMHLRQLDAIIAESELLLQKEGGLDGELKTSGSICEDFVRNTLRDFIVPHHFRIVTGFIANSDLLSTGRNLPQCDIIIVDSTVPPLLRFPNSQIEVVARESVVGIIEVKRTLTPKTLYTKEKDGKESGALAQLNSILDTLGERDTFKVDGKLNRFNKHVGFHNHSSDMPLFAVIGLGHKDLGFETQVADIIGRANSPVDFVWALDGAAVVPSSKSTTGDVLFYSHTARPAVGAWQNVPKQSFSDSVSDYYKMYGAVDPTWAYLTESAGLSRAAVFSRMVGIATLMLSRVFGNTLRENQINDYYLKS
jgi:hypothetical protein